ncbi:queuosine precursor transporter [Francisellaceae bacterium]|nr:queuosine precursor transporter [Francisellaceae bacterium]
MQAPNKSSTQNNTQFRFYSILCMLYATTLLLSNIVAQKIVHIWVFDVPAAFILFPLMYFFGNVFTEIYGYAYARQAIWMALVCNLLMVLTFEATIWLPSSANWHNGAMYSAILGQSSRIVLASIIAFGCGEFCNSYVLAKIKVRTAGRMLWLRISIATVLSQLIGSLLFIFIAFAWILPWPVLFDAAFSYYLFKVVYQIAAIPLLYYLIAFLKKKEGIEAFDTNTNFSPFRWNSKE